MPAPIAQNKYKELMDNNLDLRNKMRQAFIHAYDSLYNNPYGSLEDFELLIEGVRIRYRSGDQITINEQPYDSLTPTLKKQAYDRLEAFMKIAIARFNNQFNL